MNPEESWLQARRYTPEHLRLAREVLEDVRAGGEIGRALRRHPLPDGRCLPKHALVHAYRVLTREQAWPEDPALLRRICMKPVRTLSGVTTVTVLTKPYPCPGECIFCPTDARMPKSYLPDEPGAKRGLQHRFDPFEQTEARLVALEAIGHAVDKVELLILGGTWSAYPPRYRRWFVQRCLDALNGFDSASLEEAQAANASARHRNVGLVIETRPDRVTSGEVASLRCLGVTKVQLGAQSLDDRLLALSRRGHTVEATRRAVGLLRAAGFKIVLHWMPNLLGATPDSDRADFGRLWDDPALRPDELKIYPCILLAGTELFARWQQGEYEPYTTGQLVDLIADLKTVIPRYCRVNRVVRDIPSGHIVAGNKRTSLRMDVQRELERRGRACMCIRCREVRGRSIEPSSLRRDDLVYATGGSEEHFLSFATPDDRLAGYLRLSLPGEGAPATGLSDLEGAALVREVHIVGQSLELGTEQAGVAQHAGLGSSLMAEAEGIARDHAFSRIAVIAALGVRDYYRRLGYRLGETYMVKEIGGEATSNKR